jgi:hypothetical protein
LNDNKVSPLAILCAVGLILLNVVNRDNESAGNGSVRSAPSYLDVAEEPLTQAEAISEHWDEIKDYFSDTVSLEACSSQSGNCYELEADVAGGVIDTLYFPNGGFRSFSAEIESDGSASDVDDDGWAWDFTVDLESSTEDAVREWADATGRDVD